MFLEGWRKDIYQRRVSNVMGTWEGGVGEGLRERYEREIEQGSHLSLNVLEFCEMSLNFMKCP